MSERSVGDLVTPQVRLVEPIGRGAMGSVWRADHLALQTHVAVKFVSDELVVDDPEALARFHREATTAAQIKSPYVVQTFDAGISDRGTPYIVMELLEGETLSERLQRTGWLSLGLVQRIVRQVASALSSAHRMGIVHRDIKPDNIYLTPSDEGILCKVLDFGIAKHIHKPSLRGLTAAGSMVGTPEFMSPEQMKHGRVDAFVDLWALAVVAYCGLCTELPFAGPTLGALCINVMNGEFVPATSRRAELSPAIDDWFARAFAPQPADRFESAKALAQALAMIVDEGGFDEPAPGVDAAVSTMRLSPETVVTRRTSAMAPPTLVTLPAAEAVVSEGPPPRIPHSKVGAAWGLGLAGAMALGIVAYSVDRSPAEPTTADLVTDLPAPPPIEAPETPAPELTPGPTAAAEAPPEEPKAAPSIEPPPTPRAQPATPRARAPKPSPPKPVAPLATLPDEPDF